MDRQDNFDSKLMEQLGQRGTIIARKTSTHTLPRRQNFSEGQCADIAEGPKAIFGATNLPSNGMQRLCTRNRAHTSTRQQSWFGRPRGRLRGMLRGRPRGRPRGRLQEPTPETTGGHAGDNACKATHAQLSAHATRLK